MRFSESAADNWEKNLITFRAEERLAFTTEYPAAFSEVTGI